MTQAWKVAVVGAGGLGGALVRGLLAGRVAPTQLSVADLDVEKARNATGGSAARVVRSGKEAVEGADVVVLCVKPDGVAAALNELEPGLRGDAVLISAAAGVTLKTLREELGAKAVLVRAMPNVNVAVGHSMTALCAEPGHSGADEALQRAAWLFDQVGGTVRLSDEKLIDPATALAASGPAWMAALLEALMDGGVLAGLPREVAVQMALGMAEGTARHLREKRLHPGALKDMVMSPGGTTAAGARLLEERGVRGALMSAVDAATTRARALRGG
ncbi:MAG: pyrroline-5-carboxylate reductase [Myxococcota bacterium]